MSTDPEKMIAALEAVADAVTETLNAVGVQFGQYLADRAGFEWTVAADASGTELVVRASPGRGDVLIYPVKFVEKRWYQRETGFLSSSFEAICEDLTLLEGGRPAKHWPW
jgi:hypothetical protein